VARQSHEKALSEQTLSEQAPSGEGDYSVPPLTGIEAEEQQRYGEQIFSRVLLPSTGDLYQSLLGTEKL